MSLKLEFHRGLVAFRSTRTRRALVFARGEFAQFAAEIKRGDWDPTIAKDQREEASDARP